MYLYRKLYLGTNVFNMAYLHVSMYVQLDLESADNENWFTNRQS